MPFEVGVAVVGDPSVPFTPSGYRDEDYLVPYRERARVTLEVEPEETLGSILIRAGEELGVVVGWGDTLLDPLSYVSFYKPGHEQGERVELFSWVTLADEQGRALWRADFKSATYAQLEHAYEVGTFVEGDPFRPYLILQSGFGNGLVPDFETLVHIWSIAVDVLGGFAVAAKAYDVLNRIRDRISRGRDVTTSHMEDWRSRGGSPSALAEFCRRRPSTSDELAQFLGCAVEEAESVLWAWGFAPGEDGRWVPEPNEEAAMLRRTWEIGMYMFDDPEFSRRLARLAEQYVETGHVPELENALEEPPHDD